MQKEKNSVNGTSRRKEDPRDKDPCEFSSQFQPLIDSIPIPQFIIGMDHKVISWNRALEQYSGVRAGEIVGTNHQWQPFYKNERPTMADLIVDNATDRIRELFRGKFIPSPLVDGAYTATDFFPNLGKTGTWLHFTAAPFRDEDGNLVGAVETLEDVSELKQAEDLIAYMTEATMRVVHPLGIIRDNLSDAAGLIREGKVTCEEIVVLLDTQARNASQIVSNMDAFQKAVVEKHREIPEAYRKFLSG